MAVQLSAVSWWWRTPDGVGHVLLSDCDDCTCGQCPKRLALCGRAGDDGEKTRFRPDTVCPCCRELLAAPTLVPIES